MKNLICFCLLAAGPILSFGQIIKRYPIGATGLSVNGYCEPKFNTTYSGDSAKVYTSECGKDDIYYMVICIEPNRSFNSLSKAEKALVNYVNNLKTQFKIISSTGYSSGNKLNGNESTWGTVEYWKDNEQFNWKVKSWTDGKFLTVLVAYSKHSFTEETVNPFLDGLLFKGM
ncbi:MAG TPA: hypothetical protein VHL77_07825 [Ferruginibacter sp.]|jgi:hypothetical protein|nr:hypothetical protein [Ferruginibacter sp.]